MARKKNEADDILSPTSELVRLGAEDDDEIEEEPAVQVKGKFVRRKRFDPIEQAEIDGDPRFEIMLDPASEKADRTAVWAHADADVPLLKGRGYRIEKFSEDGYRLACGVSGEAGQDITWRDHVLMSIDRATDIKRRARENSSNREMRSQMIRKANNRTTQVRNPD